ncbi:EAL domain-containing protein [Lachnospiraceae bacterium NSJ-143]|nr:EAL domain-containing protein [Lachnospiraceae bacterium NSJ-143]
MSIRKGLLMLIPLLVVGSAALTLKSLPLPAVNAFIEAAAGGTVLDILNLIYDATFGIMSICLLVCISYSYASTFNDMDDVFRMMSVIASLGCFIAFFSEAGGTFTFANFGAIGMFPAMLCAILATAIFRVFVRHLPKIFHSYTNSVDRKFHTGISMITPLFCCIFIFALLSRIIQIFSGTGNLNELFSVIIVRLFNNMSGELIRGITFVVILDALWFFGMHGGNIMEQVAQSYFVPATSDPNIIIGKSFLDNFALTGGCGTTICLTIALIVFSKNINNKKLGMSSAPFALFNMNELLVFGLPVVLNPILLIPFMLTPIISLCIAYFATAIGFLPVVTRSVTWTTPVLFSGFAASDSVRGMVVQLIILVVGTAVYAPFIRLWENIQENHEQMMLEELSKCFWNNQKLKTDESYLERTDSIGIMAKTLATQLREDIRQNDIPVFFQPQVDNNGKIIGAESLLRWSYHGFPISPPIAVALAKEDELFDKLTYLILETAAQKTKEFVGINGNDFIVSVNVTARQIDSLAFVDHVISLVNKHNINGCFCLEITEEDALERYENIESHLKLLKRSGVTAAIDDFSMGHTSLKYLQNNYFDFVKLDGSLVLQLAENQRCQDIVRSIVVLGNRLGFTVVAEYVENETIRELLLKTGCHMFQGYLFSPAIPSDKLLSLMKGEY